MAVAGAVTVANLYYNQPLLGDIGRTLGADGSALGLVPTLTQVGYAVGMLFLVPLGDSLERREVILVLCGCVGVALVVAGLAPGLNVLVAASFAIGVTTVVPQMLIPFAAQLAAPSERGRVVGAAMSITALVVVLWSGRRLPAAQASAT